MSDKPNVIDRQVERSVSVLPVWRIVLKRELTELWIGGSALYLLILFCILMSVTSFLQVVESELNMIPPKEMIYLTVMASISYGLFIGIINGADSVSGERDRATLEPLLLAPTGRLQIVIGKFLAAISPWPITLLIALPYVIVLSQGDEALGKALLLSTMMGLFLATAFTGFAMLMSILSNSNRTSLFVSLVVYILFLIPTQFPGVIQKGALGDFVQALSPLESTNEFLEKTIVNNRTIEEKSPFLVGPAMYAVVVVVLLFWFVGPRLRLEGGRRSIVRTKWSRAAGLLLIVYLMASVGVSPTMALQGEPTPADPAAEETPSADTSAVDPSAEEASSTEPSTADPSQEAASASSEQPLQISIDAEYRVMKTGDSIEFKTVVTNNGEEETPDMVVAMNLVNLGAGDPVDPEDWAPLRSQDVTALPPGESAELDWVINTVLEGDYMAYMVLIPEPDGPEATSQPVATTGLHMTVAGFSSTNPGGILPLAIGMPLALIVGASFLRRRWRRGIDTNVT